jgi:hypothetical protein
MTLNKFYSIIVKDDMASSNVEDSRKNIVNAMKSIENRMILMSILSHD